MLASRGSQQRFDTFCHPEERSDEGSAFLAGRKSRSFVAALLRMTRWVAALLRMTRWVAALLRMTRWVAALLRMTRWGRPARLRLDGRIQFRCVGAFFSAERPSVSRYGLCEIAVSTERLLE